MSCSCCRYRTSVEEVPVGDFELELGVAHVVREGSDITLVGWGQQVSAGHLTDIWDRGYILQKLALSFLSWGGKSGFPMIFALLKFEGWHSPNFPPIPPERAHPARKEPTRKLPGLAYITMMRPGVMAFDPEHKIRLKTQKP